jgi:hypothetical protein
MRDSVTAPKVCEAGWQTAIAIFEARMRGRFFAPVDAIIALEEAKKEETFGFAILAIDCLVIETLQGFREGVADHDGKSGRLFTNFLIGWESFESCVPRDADARKLAKSVYSHCRCALLHSGATDGELRVGISGPTFRFNGDRVEWINRTSLHQNLKREFDAYLASLRSEASGEPRRNFKKKMDAISGVAGRPA